MITNGLLQLIVGHARFVAATRDMNENQVAPGLTVPITVLLDDALNRHRAAGHHKGQRQDDKQSNDTPESLAIWFHLAPALLLIAT